MSRRPDPSRVVAAIAERALARLAFVGPGRLISAALSMVVVAAGCWWLLRAPAPPVERDLPFTPGASVAPESPDPSGSTDGAGGSSTGSGADGTSGSSGSSGLPDGSTRGGGTVVVQVAGAVVSPGVYTMPAGARVHELIAAAGGVTTDGDPSAIALAVVLRDGERVYVPRVGEVVSGSAGAGAGAGPAAGDLPAVPLDLNRATAAELDSLPGIGPATASAIVEHRERNGPFASVDDLLDVPGIGPSKLENLRDLVVA
jgi:competence protein ComEA